MSGRNNRCYVYEHWRPDQDVCFWVGKGTGDRAYRFKRNATYNAVVVALAQLGMCVEVRMVASAMTPIDALTLEEARIVFWRSSGVILTNRNNGGSGAGKEISDKTRQKLREANLGRKHSTKTRAKMKAAHIARFLAGSGPSGRPVGFKHAPETIAKIAAANRGRLLTNERKQHLRDVNLGKRHSEETRRKMADSQLRRDPSKYVPSFPKGSKRSDETRARMSAAQKGHPVSAETRKKMALIAKQKDRGENGKFRPAVSSS